MFEFPLDKEATPNTNALNQTEARFATEDKTVTMNFLQQKDTIEPSSEEGGSNFHIHQDNEFPQPESIAEE